MDTTRPTSPPAAEPRTINGGATFVLVLLVGVPLLALTAAYPVVAGWLAMSAASLGCLGILVRLINRAQR